MHKILVSSPNLWQIFPTIVILDHTTLKTMVEMAILITVENKQAILPRIVVLIDIINVIMLPCGPVPASSVGTRTTMLQIVGIDLIKKSIRILLPCLQLMLLH